MTLKAESSRLLALWLGVLVTFFSRIVMPWYLNGLLNSINSARSGLMVNGATIMSARSVTSSPIKPVHSFLALTAIFRVRS